MSLHDGDMEIIDNSNDGDDISLDLEVPDTVADKPDTAQRGYSSPYTIRFTGCQRDRFPANLRPEIRSMLANDNDHEPYPVGFTGEWEDFPRVARLRMNLTCLSQHYVLYFVAYRGYIHVYRPNRNGRSAIQGPPLVILDPEQSKTPMAKFAHGHVNPSCPHEVNHMITGDLGEKEILLIARDNGDVVAWYTHTIAHWIEARSRCPRARARDATSTEASSPKHFFAASVGLSAWGLAIHAKSRLIAVSANTSEVTVFAFALGGEDVEAEFKHLPARQNSPLSRMNEENAEGDKSSLGESLRKRKRTWRIIITLGREATNIPSISFCDDPRGNADRVVAIGINGCLWVANIWTIGPRRIVVFPHNVPYPHGRPYDSVTGWNILAVTDAQLRPTKSVRAAIGLRPSRAVYHASIARGVWYDISKSMVQVKDDAAHQDHITRMRSFRAAQVSRRADSQIQNVLLTTDAKERDAIVTTSSEIDNKRGFLPEMTILNGNGHHFQGEQEFADERDSFLYIKNSETRRLEFERARPLHGCVENDSDAVDAVRGISFLRANSEDIEMLTLDKDGCGVVCHHVLPALTHDESLVPWDYLGLGKRIAMLLTIPELNLVILGSMHGRVALITLTKPPKVEGSRTPTRAFRVDAVLPFHGEVRRQPWVCLLGIAVSPVPETRAQGLRLRKDRVAVYGGRRKPSEMPEKEPDPPRKWRLILNYQDHTILQYEITRKDAGAEGETSWEARALRKQGVEPGNKKPGADCSDVEEDDDDDEEEEEEEGEDDWPLPEVV
ncbi:hypothetical protein N0V93_003747 [Gnomoniopsis smithogilvyi]|uniref:Uncharacterized protein n=1 Tax=Gnomoniopsis smithogilvyi TaxID=1191159 RepID=A0A9W9D0B7_9PEZI|nr:hypothetical protein N0V93_003747 [Gnomoniopsis smithogilvyi]